MAKKRKLTKDEMKEMEVNNLNKQLRNAAILIEQQRLALKKYELEIKSLNAKAEQEKIQKKINELQQQHKEQNDKAIKFVKDLKNKYKIKDDKFGYNPDTGDIIEEEK